MASLGEGARSAAAEVRPQGRSLHALRPCDLTRLLNSTPLGTVISERQLYRHRSSAGYQIGGNAHIDLVQYIAWLLMERERIRTGAPQHSKLSESGDSPVNAKQVFHLVENQKYRCALTGRRLTPQTAALDHIVPISQGGKHTINNAQVLDKEVNRAKHTMTNEEFIALCREIVSHMDSRERRSSK